MFEIFNNPEAMIEFEQYADDPQKILSDKSLVICIEDQIYQYEDAIKLIISQFVFKQILPIHSMPMSLNFLAVDYLENHASSESSSSNPEKLNS